MSAAFVCSKPSEESQLTDSYSHSTNASPLFFTKLLLTRDMMEQMTQIVLNAYTFKHKYYKTDREFFKGRVKESCTGMGCYVWVGTHRHMSTALQHNCAHARTTPKQDSLGEVIRNGEKKREEVPGLNGEQGTQTQLLAWGWGGTVPLTPGTILLSSLEKLKRENRGLILLLPSAARAFFSGY